MPRLGGAGIMTFNSCIAFYYKWPLRLSSSRQLYDVHILHSGGDFHLDRQTRLGLSWCSDLASSVRLQHDGKG
ncbi:hypothetical protein M406DRAFT_61742 [Cryphonectria parasitica EP155]|uniref:Uncharacterized protein n=1 Tax=Cryphonectria parasitica (strain ATCC 38755 / EP155) TaxID=660469 RepID=A0A9P5CS71_CRYP1|nr:uncharacterized protein M406DRAFT_61742 [Cryphonectria parasitica EP155]KAF3768021.1 hypothetical protein M406DRAFT_61742 [Cryphonectria parasitica EP155]